MPICSRSKTLIWQTDPLSTDFYSSVLNTKSRGNGFLYSPDSEI